MKTKTNRSIAKRVLTYLLTLLMVIGIPLLPGTADKVSGAENVQVKIEQTGGYFAVQGDRNVPLKVRVTNNSSETISFTAHTSLKQTSGKLTEPSPNEASISLDSGKSTELVFAIDIADNAPLDLNKIDILLIDQGKNKGDILRSKSVSINISKKTSTSNTDPSGNTLPLADLVHSLSNGDAIIAGVDNELTLTFRNKGNTVMKDTKVTLELPEGISIDNASGTLSVGYLNIGTAKTVVFPLTADTGLESKNYPVTVRIEFFDSKNSSKSIEQTLYIPVQASGSSSMDGIAITNINTPPVAIAGNDFTVSFNVTNQGDFATGRLKITAEVPDGLANRTKNIFLEQSIAKGQSKSYSVTYFSEDGAAEKNYPIMITVEPASGGDAADTVMQYTGVFIENGGSGSIKTPQLMVSNYSYGGSFVQAGDQFRLDIGLTNTSSNHTLQNIKVTLQSGDGTFIPVNSSNSFYINRIDRNGYADYSIYLSVKPDAEQKTTSINVDMSYEDSSGNAFTATDVISIPIMQETRLIVDDIIAPPELYAGMQNGVNVEFYNMGKTTLNNLRIYAEGDFDTMESTSYYAGNMESGRSDSYNFSFIPRGPGVMEGTVYFTYEDASGDQQVIENQFSFDIMEMPVWNEEPFPIDENMGGKKTPWLPIGAGAVAVAGAAGIVLWKRHRKKKMNREMEIDE